MHKNDGETMHNTLNDTKSNAKTTSIAILNERVAEGIDLALVTKQAHWNLRGIQFIAFHEMLDKFRTDLDDNIDTMAERIVQLGGTVQGTLQKVAAGAKLPAYPTEITAITDHIPELVKRYGAAANAVRAATDSTAEVGDADTTDILTGYSRMLDKALWFLEAHQG